ncbi:MAG: type II toxin-antitoxin system YafQ family toxin [Planctomycetaceae bacterium]|jgi:mRNA interferase YafQ|nr:type II toxin-antitoxin system YafQ family toxin [Planctomycetaceae bacterium]
MLTIVYTKQMKRDAKRAKKRGKDMQKLVSTLTLLAQGVPMPPRYRDHQLKGKLSDMRECHVGGEGDWLLLYKIYEDNLVYPLPAPVHIPTYLTNNTLPFTTI